MIRWTYLDTCAAVKLFVAEPESDALVDWLTAHPDSRPVTSDLTRTELRRALHSAKVNQAIWKRVEHWLDRCAHIRLTREVCDGAGHLSPGSTLRSLDAVHVASALVLRPALDAFITYDKRLGAAAQNNGLPVEAPAGQ